MSLEIIKAFCDTQERSLRDMERQCFIGANDTSIWFIRGERFALGAVLRVIEAIEKGEYDES